MIPWIFFPAALFFLAYVHWVEPNWFRLRRETVRLKRPLAKPLRILHLSDMHFTGRRYFLERFFDRLAGLEVDFVFATGDLIDAAKGIEPCIFNLKKLKPRRGTYVVLGNHDYSTYPFVHQLGRIVTGAHYGVQRPEEVSLRLQTRLTEAGFRLLSNRHVRLSLEEELIVNIIGIDDPITGRARFSEAFKEIKDEGLKLALIHSPTHFAPLEKYGIDIAFAGHTHGGQIRIPGLGPLPLIYHLEPVIDSTDRYGFKEIVSRGMGASPFVRFRLFCRPEALLVELRGPFSR